MRRMSNDEKMSRQRFLLHQEMSVLSVCLLSSSVVWIGHLAVHACVLLLQKCVLDSTLPTQHYVINVQRAANSQI